MIYPRRVFFIIDIGVEDLFFARIELTKASII